MCEAVHRVVIGTGTELMDMKIILHFFIVRMCGLAYTDCGSRVAVRRQLLELILVYHVGSMIGSRSSGSWQMF